MQGVRLSEVRGIDSHVFEQKWLSPDNDRWLCFHSNFSACFDGEKDIRYFFAELTGIKGPQLVTRCVRLSKSSGTARSTLVYMSIKIIRVIC
jgi:hypothetical protein